MGRPKGQTAKVLERQLKILALRQSGMKLQAIAKEFSISYQCVQQELKKAGYVRPVKTPKKRRINGLATKVCYWLKEVGEGRCRLCGKVFCLDEMTGLGSKRGPYYVVCRKCNVKRVGAYVLTNKGKIYSRRKQKRHYMRQKLLLSGNQVITS